MFHHVSNPTRRRRHERCARRERFEDDVGETVHVAAVVAHRRRDDDVGGREPGADRVLRQVAEEANAVRDTGVPRAPGEFVAEIPGAGKRKDRPRA